MIKMKSPFNRPFIAGKELWMEMRLGCKKALLKHSCTGALEMAAILRGGRKDREGVSEGKT